MLVTLLVSSERTAASIIDKVQMLSSPVVSGGRIYLRTFDALYAIGKK